MTRGAAVMVAVGLLPGLGLTACAEGGSDWSGTVRDSADVEIVSTTRGSVWAGSAGWTVEEDLRIGTAAGEPEYQFGQIVGIDVGSDGRIYVLDQQARQVRVFGPDGRFVLAMGRPGSGPGEMGQSVGPVFVGPGDTVIVPDMSQQRITLFTAAGEPAGSAPLYMTDGIPVRWLKAANQDLIQQAMIMAMPGQTGVEPKNLVLRRSPRGQLLDTLLVLPAGQTMDFSGGQPRMTLFAPEPVWAIGRDDRLIHGNNAEYRLLIHAPGGGLERIVEKRVDRRPITEADQAEFRALLRRMWEQAGVPPQAIQMMAQSMAFADYYPAYMNVLGGPYGTLWVQSVQTPETVKEQGGTFDVQDLGGPTWDIFDPDGRFLGGIQMPPRFNPLQFDDDHIYGVLRDELDVQYVVRVRLNRPVLPG